CENRTGVAAGRILYCHEKPPGRGGIVRGPEGRPRCFWRGVMSFLLRGHRLNQRQLDAMIPVLNDNMHNRRRKADFEEACVAALEEAGCPLGYDTTLPGRETSIETRAARWVKDGQVGMSSRAIHSHMTGAPDRSGFRHPLDPDDLNRCLLL